MPSSFARLLAVVFVSSAAVAPSGQATLLDANDVAISSIVVFETDFGDITVGLFDSTTPQTVANFLNYVEGTTVNGGQYNPGFFHRYVPGFVIQAGYSNLFLQEDFPGLQGDTLSNPLPVDAPVVNEPFVSNTLGTIAMAKVGGNPNSATSQFFFNLDDNSANLDVQNGGFTAFGRVIDGLDLLLNGTAALTPVNLSGLFLDGAYVSVPVEDFENPLDLDNWVSYTVSTVLQGDYNGDGFVNAADYTAWADNFGSLTELDADGNYDGVVDAADYTIWADNFGQTSGNTAPSTIPEPTTAALIALTVPMLLKRRSA
ncbi:MAG: peptidylprolyl isomerase [Planctomycetota bacterium]